MMTRSQLADELDLGASSPTTTYVVEVHSEAGPELLEEITGPGRVEATADAYLYTATVDDGMFWVDQIDERFWSFHTETVPARRGRSFFKAAVDSRRDLDWLWLPSAHLRHLWPGAVTRRVRASFNGSKMVHEDTSRDLRIQAAGRDADSVLTFLESSSEYRASVSFDSVQASVVDDDFGRVEEGVTRDGRFAVSGDSFELHLQFVRSVVQRYKQLVTLCEDRTLDFTPFDTVAGDGGGTMSGAPIVVDFSRPIPDLDDFLSELLSSREPFRLWGRPIVSGDHAEVEAVDLHMGQRMRLELGREWMRVLLQPGACGNSVVRLVSNLQHTFDGALSFRDPQLDAALSRRPA